MIKLTNVCKYYASGFLRKRIKKVIEAINLRLNKGDIIGLVGSSGSGKSTLGKLILGLEKPDSGKICFQQKDISQFNNKDIKDFYSRVQMIPQHPDAAFNPKLKIKTSINEVFKFYNLCSSNKQEQYLIDTLKHVHLLPSVLDRYPYQLSGGEIQRLAIARAILLKPDFLILDEITSMLDLSVQAQIIHLLRDIHQKHKTGYLFITHNIPLANQFCHKILAINNGVIY